jgi:hypothetical protein
VTIKIANAAQLTTALAAAKGGETFLLAAGNYGTYTIRDKLFASEVRIESENPDNAAIFDRLVVRGSSSLTFVGLDLGRALAEGEPNFTQLNNVRDSENITFSKVRFHGSLDNNPSNDGLGLHVLNTKGIVFEDVLFTELMRGVVVEKSFNLVARSSEWKTIRSDGMNVIATEGVMISDNLFTDFRPVFPDHGDAIQFWNTGQTKGSRDITIENNRVFFPTHSGVKGEGMQGIFISDPLAFGYENVLIRNNILYSNGAFHGINVDGGRKLQITGNTVLSQSGNDNDFWIRVGDSDGVLIDDNIADTFILKNVTKLFQGENVNLKVTPSKASLIPDRNNPSSLDDLYATDIGFVPLADSSTLEQAPVSDALASALSGWIEAKDGAKVMQSPVAADGEEQSASQIFAAVPVIEAEGLTVAEMEPAPMSLSEPWSAPSALFADHFAFA